MPSAINSGGSLFPFRWQIPHLFRDIHDVFKFLANDSNCRCIVLSGNGKAFCAGIDLKGL
jgi:enoyl-CoA hydratase/carnithine racemase